MFAGILAGILSVLFMSGSYIFSRGYIQKHKDPVKLAVYSQLVIWGAGALLFALSLWLTDYPWSMRFGLLLAGQVVFFLVGQTCFFLVLKKVEATRASSLLGTKILVLAIISCCIGDYLSLGQWIAVILCTIAAVGMNFSGGKIPVSSFFWLMCSVWGYALCDIFVTHLVQMMPGESMMLSSLAISGICFTIIGFTVLPGLIKYPPGDGGFKDAIPYCIVYFLSVVMLYACFGLLGVVFGSIVQSSRGIVSIAMGVLLLRLGLEKTEPDVSGKIWIRRLVMAILMLTAIVLFSCSV